MGLPLNKVLKRIIMVFTILCCIALVVFSVELILINRDTSNRGEEPTISGNGQNGEGDDGTEPDANGDGSQDGADQNGEQGQGGEEPSQGGRPDPTGTRHEELVTGGTLSLYVDSALFNQGTIEDPDDLFVFTWSGDGAASLDIGMVYFPRGIDAFAESFLVSRYHATDFDAQGEDYIGRSPLRGYLFTGESDAGSLETWVYTSAAEGYGNMGLAFTVTYQNITQRNAIYDILGTLDIEYN